MTNLLGGLVLPMPAGAGELGAAAGKVPVKVGETENTVEPQVPIEATSRMNSAQVSMLAAERTAEPASVMAPETASVPATVALPEVSTVKRGLEPREPSVALTPK